MTSFIMRNVLPNAHEVVDRAERIVLSERDTMRVLELLESPPNRLVLRWPPRGGESPGSNLVAGLARGTHRAAS